MQTIWSTKNKAKRKELKALMFANTSFYPIYIRYMHVLTKCQ